MKKLLVILAGLCFALAANAAYKDGVYDGVGDGLHGKINVQVTIKDGKIANIEVTKHEETDMIIQAPIDEMIPAIIEAGTIEGIESISGATNSSNGIKQAVS
ncbi:MAG: FMN-binding protein, partial [Burkholderiales bacterium]|nr:FMN-binding protein [Burkholderiales bacterium]